MHSEIIFISFIILITLKTLTMLSSTPFSNHKHSIDKASPIECGFDMKQKSSRIPFSIHFFALLILFLIFDIETILLFPTPILLNFLPDPSLYPHLILFLLILLMGLIHEIRQGILMWSN